MRKVKIVVTPIIVVFKNVIIITILIQIVIFIARFHVRQLDWKLRLSLNGGRVIQTWRILSWRGNPYCFLPSVVSCLSREQERSGHKIAGLGK